MKLRQIKISHPEIGQGINVPLGYVSNYRSARLNCDMEGCDLFPRDKFTGSITITDKADKTIYNYLNQIDCAIGCEPMKIEFVFRCKSEDIVYSSLVLKKDMKPCHLKCYFDLKLTEDSCMARLENYWDQEICFGNLPSTKSTLVPFGCALDIFVADRQFVVYQDPNFTPNIANTSDTAYLPYTDESALYTQSDLANAGYDVSQWCQYSNEVTQIAAGGGAGGANSSPYASITYDVVTTWYRLLKSTTCAEYQAQNLAEQGWNIIQGDCSDPNNVIGISRCIGDFFAPTTARGYNFYQALCYLTTQTLQKAGCDVFCCQTTFFAGDVGVVQNSNQAYDCALKYNIKDITIHDQSDVLRPGATEAPDPKRMKAKLQDFLSDGKCLFDLRLGVHKRADGSECVAFEHSSYHDTYTGIDPVYGYNNRAEIDLTNGTQDDACLSLSVEAKSLIKYQQKDEANDLYFNELEVKYPGECTEGEEECKLKVFNKNPHEIYNNQDDYSASGLVLFHNTNLQINPDGSACYVQGVFSPDLLSDTPPDPVINGFLSNDNLVKCFQTDGCYDTAEVRGEPFEYDSPSYLYEGPSITMKWCICDDGPIPFLGNLKTAITENADLTKYKKAKIKSYEFNPFTNYVTFQILYSK